MIIPYIFFSSLLLFSVAVGILWTYLDLSNDQIFSELYKLMVCETVLLYGTSIMLCLMLSIYFTRGIVFSTIFYCVLLGSISISMIFFVTGLFNIHFYQSSELTQLYFLGEFKEKTSLYVLYILESIVLPIYIVSSVAYYLVLRFKKCHQNKNSSYKVPRIRNNYEQVNGVDNSSLV